MNFGKILDLMANKDINQAELFSLVDSIKNMDLSNEENLRGIIRKVSKLANKDIDIDTEKNIIDKIQTEGVPQDIFSLFK